MLEVEGGTAVEVVVAIDGGTPEGSDCPSGGAGAGGASIRSSWGNRRPVRR